MDDEIKQVRDHLSSRRLRLWLFLAQETTGYNGFNIQHQFRPHIRGALNTSTALQVGYQTHVPNKTNHRK